MSQLLKVVLEFYLIDRAWKIEIFHSIMREEIAEGVRQMTYVQELFSQR